MPDPKPKLRQPIQTDKPPIFDIHAEQSDVDPDMPYSGGSSSAFFQDEQQSKTVDAEKRKAKQQRSDLLPVAEDIFKFLEEERIAIGDLRSYLAKLPPGVSGIEIKDEYRARELYLTYLKRFEGWMINRLSKTPANKLKG